MADGTVEAIAARVREELLERLSPSGWAVEVGVEDATNDRFWVTVDHPLTDSSGISVDARKDFSPALARWLAHPEFERIACAPSGSPHAPIIRAIRANAKGFHWPDSVAGSVTNE